MRILAERRQEELARDVSWLDQLIDQERGDQERGRAGARAGARSALVAAAAVAPYRGERRPAPLASVSQLQRASITLRTVMPAVEPGPPAQRPSYGQEDRS